MKKFYPVVLTALCILLPANSQAGKAPNDLQTKLTLLMVGFNKGKIRPPKAMGYLEEKLASSKRKNDKSMIYKTMAEILYYQKYPTLSAMFASKSLKLSKDPSGSFMKNNWTILARVSKSYPIQYILEDLASVKKFSNITPPAFANNWRYVVGNAQLTKNHKKKALKSFLKLTVGDRYFLPAQYQVAMIYHGQGDYKNAEIALRTILSPQSRSVSPISNTEKAKVLNYAYMALGRLLYEQRNFVQATRYYRQISRESPLFYRSLFEQGWSLFLSGNPQHALGSLHGANSPFFGNQFNPESKVLEAMIFYWLCRYEDSRNSLADFAENHSKSVELLRGFLDRKRLSPDTAYQLFENLISGVSGDSLGIPRKVLQTAAEEDSMLLLRDQYATLLGERQKLEGSDFALEEIGFSTLRNVLDEKIEKIQKGIGKQYLVELRSLKEEFDELYAQSQFLYLELLMSEKEQLLGRELHATTKVTKISESKNIRDWSNKTQSWARGKDEFWWDEIGFHIVDVKPQCKL